MCSASVTVVSACSSASVVAHTVLQYGQYLEVAGDCWMWCAGVSEQRTLQHLGSN